MNQVSVELSELECERVILEIQSTTTITFFDGDAPTAVLKERLASIIRANPWLTGRIIKGESRLSLVWDEPAADTETLLAPYFDELPPAKCAVHRGMTYEAINKAIKKHKGVTAKRSIACIGKDEPLAIGPGVVGVFSNYLESIGGQCVASHRPNGEPHAADGDRR